MKKLILEHIEAHNTLNKHGIENVKRDNPEELSLKALHIITHTQHLLDVVVEAYIEEVKKNTILNDNK